MNNVLRIYGKKRTAKRFKPFDYGRGVFVGNLIHATVWERNKRESVQSMVDYMNANNPDYVFELR